MRNLCLLGIQLLISLLSFANPINISVPASGNWKITSTWQLNRLPQDGDTVLIPTGKTVVIDNVQNLGLANLYLKIYGTLLFSNGKLWLGSNSTVTVYTGGVISGTGSPSETLKIGTAIKYEGSMGSVTGPIIATAATGIAPTGFTLFNEVSLPVRFVGFNIAKATDGFLLQWATAEEMNSNCFQVQKSLNGTDWSTIGTVPASGNSGIIQKYGFIDHNINNNVSYYRIRELDIDGRSFTTSVKMARKENINDLIEVHPAGGNSLYIHFSEKINADVTVQVSNMMGQKISYASWHNPIGQQILSLPQLNHGIYVVTLTDGKSLKQTKRVLL